jgi:hypothetical protein
MVGFFAALRHRNSRRCSIIRAASSRSEKSSLPLRAPKGSYAAPVTNCWCRVADLRCAAHELAQCGRSGQSAKVGQMPLPALSCRSPDVLHAAMRPVRPAIDAKRSISFMALAAERDFPVIAKNSQNPLAGPQTDAFCSLSAPGQKGWISASARRAPSDPNSYDHGL